jgi:3-phenylpropionate/trans-cinnamate dioxygenase ferredoxin reductase component
MMDSAEIVFVGGGLAAAAAAESYRKAGGTGSVTILSADTALPVHRPPLSKEYLRGDETRDKVFVHPSGFYEEQGIEVRLDTPVEAIDRSRQVVTLADGQQMGYDTLVLATGARPRRLPVPGGDLPGVFYLRSLQSSETLIEASQNAERAVIIGAGFVGMEVAATLTQRGLRCTVVEMAPRMWARIVPPEVSDYLQAYYRDRGVELRFGAGVKAITGGGRAECVVLESGEELPAELVVAGVGAELNTQLAAKAGLQVDGGVLVDEYFRTSDPLIYAIGDIANFPDPVAGHIHLEHWDNALNMGRALGTTLAGQATAFTHVAYFFSDMFDQSLNMIGYPANPDEVVIRGNPADGRFTAVYIKEGTVRAALMINDDQHFDAWTALVADRAAVSGMREVLLNPAADPGVPVA